MTMSRMINSQTKRLNNSSFNVQRDLHYFQLVELGRLSASLIHEISTPLTAVSLTIEELHRERPDKLIRKARKDIKYLEEYVDAARQQLSGDSNKSSFSMTIAIHQVVMLLGSRAKTKNTKILIQTIGSIRLFGERVKFQQIIANLINNAIESYDDIYDRQKIVNVKVSIGKYNTVQITVSDQGKGISNKDKEKIFDAFYTTKHINGKGLGIGLSTVKQFVERDFDGQLSFSSDRKNGTKFVVQIPLYSHRKTDNEKKVIYPKHN